MALVEQQQLSLNVGGKHKPEVASFKVGGKIPTERELAQDDRVLVTIANADGEVIAHWHGDINVSFKRHKGSSRSPAYTERIHAIDLD